jgi:hypothetical protein
MLFYLPNGQLGVEPYRERGFCAVILRILDTDFSKVFAVLIPMRCALSAGTFGRLAAH